MDKPKIRVLLVEDDEDDYILTRELLSQVEDLNVDLQWESDFDAALHSISRNAHDVYLLDCNLGEHTGLDLLHEALALGCVSPIIFLTGQQNRRVDLEAMRAGAADYLIKGRFDAAALERSIRYALERRQAREALQRAQADLETRVKERTGELAAANDELRREVAERRRAEVEISKIGEELRRANAELSRWVSELKLRNREITLLRDMSELLQTCPSTKELGEVVAQAARQLFPGQDGGLYLLSASRQVVEEVAEWSASVGLCGESVFAPEDCWALRRCRPHRVTPDHPGLSCAHFGPLRPDSSLCLPILAHGEALGTLVLVQREEPPAEDEASDAALAQLAQTVTSSIALALSNLRLRDSLMSQSVRDPLTGLLNRRFLEESLERELRKAARKHATVALLLADIDHFKSYNDQHGHEAGDAVLCAIAELLTRRLRSSDSVCRLGGEEFTVVLPETPLEVALARAEELCQAARRLKVTLGARTLGEVTLSVGVACFPQHAQATLELLRAADAAMYAAKEKGRDRVETACADAPQSHEESRGAATADPPGAATA